MSSNTATHTPAVSQKLRSFASKYVKDAPKDKDGVPIPGPKNDIFERMDLGSKMSQDNSIDDTIDVFPDTRYVVKYIIYNVMKLYKTMDQERPLLSPSSFVAYCLYQLYAFALINDLYGRPHPSYPANQFMDADSRSDLLDAFCESYTPPFMLTIFNALSNTSDPKRPGLQFFCTLAGSRFMTDFGRYLPPQIFVYAHNMSCEADTSRNVQAALENLAISEIFLDMTDVSIRVAHYLSLGISNDTYYDSWLLEAVKTLFSPVTGKSLLRRSNIESISLESSGADFTMASNDVMSNQYVLFLAACPDNVYSTTEFISAFSNIIQSAFPTAVKLGAVPDSQSGLTITVHGYSLQAAPTWHSRKIDDSDKITLKTKLRTSKYAETVKFLQPTKYVVKETLEYPDDSKKSWSSGFLLYKNVAHKESADPDKEISFSSELHEFPNVHYLNPYTSGDGPVSQAMLAGLLIESFEVDGSSVPMPDSQIGLAPNNRQFLQGSLPLSFIHKGYTASVEHNITPVPRTVARSRVQKIAHDLYDTAQHRLGYLDIDQDHAGQQAPVGFTIVEHVRNVFHMFNRLALSTNSVPSKPPASVHVWSPYRYVNSRKEEQPAEKSTFMIFNHRTLYGTHIPLVSTRHPALVIPLS